MAHLRVMTRMEDGAHPSTRRKRAFCLIGSTVTVVALGLPQLGCGFIPQSQVDEYETRLSTQQQVIEAQQDQLDELSREYDFTLSQQVLLQKEYEQLAAEIERMGTNAMPPPGTGSANVTVTCLDLPRCSNGSMTWKETLTETNGVSVEFTHGVFYYRVHEGEGWSEPRDVSYYDDSLNPVAWPIRLMPNEEHQSGHRSPGCFSEERYYTSIYFGHDAKGNDIVAMGTVVADGRS